MTFADGGYVLEPKGNSVSAATSGAPSMASCPSCGAASWKVDADVTNRAAIIVSPDYPNPVLVDRVEPADSTGIVIIGGIQCFGCGLDLAEGSAAYREVAVQAGIVLADRGAAWAVMTDYRQL